MAAYVDQHQAVIALAVLAAVFLGFLTERFPPSAVATAGVGAFLALGLIDTADIGAVLSNPAPITIAAMFVLSGALVRTGVLEAAAQQVMQRAQSAPLVAFSLLIVGTVAASAFVNNTPVVMVLIPIVIRLAISVGWAPTRVLIPLSYAAILGGTCTLIGTSTNLIVAGVSEQQGLAPFTIFEITPIGLVTATVCTLFMFGFSRFVLPNRMAASDLMGVDADVEFFSELTVSADAPFIGRPLGEVAVLKRPGTRILAIRQAKTFHRARPEERIVRGGDRIVIMTTMAELLSLRMEDDFEITGTSTLKAVKSARHRKTVEAVVAPGRGGPIGTVKDLRLRRFGVQILGVHRHLHVPGPDLGAVRLRAADRVLLEGSAEGLAAAAEETNLINISTPRSRSYRRRKAPIAIGVLAGVVLLAAFNVMPLLALAILGIAVILILRCVDAEEAWHAIDGGILILIFAMLVIGAGLQKTGAVDLVVDQLAPSLAGLSPFLTLIAIYLLANVLTEFVTNNAVAVILTPVVLSLADTLALDPRALVITVMFGASASFATPIGYQTNTMVYGAGDYRFVDFLKLGLPMAVIAGLVTCTTIWMMLLK